MSINIRLNLVIQLSLRWIRGEFKVALLAQSVS